MVVAPVMNMILMNVMNVKINMFWMEGNVINLISILQTVKKHQRQVIKIVTIAQNVLVGIL